MNPIDFDITCKTRRLIRKAFACALYWLFHILIFHSPVFLVAQNTPGIPAPVSGEKKRDLRLENATAIQLIDLYQQLTKKRLIREANLTAPQGVNIIAPDKVTEAEEIRLIEAGLLSIGIILVPGEDNVIKVVNAGPPISKNPRTEGVPIYASEKDLPPGDQLATYFMALANITPTDALGVFGVSGGSSIPGQPTAGGSSLTATFTPVPNSQALLITAKASQIRNLIKIKELVDTPPSKVKQYSIVLQRADAAEVVKMINELLQARRTRGGGSFQVQQQGGQPGTVPIVSSTSSGGGDGITDIDVKFVPDPRTNRIIFITRAANFEYIEGLIKEFDAESETKGLTEIRLKYVKAHEVLPVLKTLLEGKDEGSRTGASPTGQSTGAPQRGSNDQAQPGSSGGSGTKASLISTAKEDTTPEATTVGKTKLIADNKSNSILVSGPPENITLVETILGKLDNRPQQVLISSVIGQMTLDDNLEWGIDILHHYSNVGRINTGDIGVASGIRTRSGTLDTIINPRSLTAATAFPLPTGLTIYGAFGTALDYFVKALESTSRFKILNRPTIYTENNQPAYILSGRKVAVPTSTLSSLNTGTTNNASVSASIGYQDVVLRLDVKPLIHDSDSKYGTKEVTLEIGQQNDTIVGSQTISGNTVPTIGTQQLKTWVTVPDGSTIVIGGLTSESDQKTESGVPFLSKIPILGYLFKNSVKTTNRTELLVLIQPTIINTQKEQAVAQTLELLRTNVGVDGVKNIEPPPPKDYKKLFESSDVITVPINPSKKSLGKTR